MSKVELINAIKYRHAKIRQFFSIIVERVTAIDTHMELYERLRKLISRECNFQLSVLVRFQSSITLQKQCSFWYWLDICCNLNDFVHFLHLFKSHYYLMLENNENRSNDNQSKIFLFAYRAPYCISFSIPIPDKCADRYYDIHFKYRKVIRFEPCT